MPKAKKIKIVKIKEYKINYSFNGYGCVRVNAKNEKEAKKMFYEGNAEYNDEGDDYEIFEIEEVKAE